MEPNIHTLKGYQKRKKTQIRAYEWVMSILAIKRAAHAGEEAGNAIADIENAIGHQISTEVAELKSIESDIERLSV